MEFRIESKGNENVHKYATEDVEIAKKFGNSLKKELGDFLVGVMVFGSSARKETTTTSDIDVLLITDDTTTAITPELVEAYRILVDNSIRKYSSRLHVTSMTFTSFWEQVKAGDPIVINILRDGFPLLDIGFFNPLQLLLKEGRIRPSEESIWRYYGRAPKTLLNSRWHILQATLDLYWAVIDSAHAALMRKGQMPPTPEHVADILERAFVKQNILEKRYVETMRKFYRLSKMITHREIREIKGEEYEHYYKEADDFVRRMKRLVEKKF